MTMLMAAAISALVCLALLGMTWSRIVDSHSAASILSLRHGQMALFTALTVFWSWNGWKAWVRYHAANADFRKVV
jgi:hypothetical protein